jgi:hypothetical protein
VTTSDQVTRDVLPSETDAFPYRVLLAVPDARTIPIFALGVEARREAVESTAVSREAHSSLIGGNLSRTLERRYGPHRLINVRGRVGERTAIYSSWLTFPDRVQAETFVRENARFGVVAITAKMQAHYEARKHQLENGTAAGRYDLSRLDQNARLKRARLYVEESAAIDQLNCNLHELAVLRKSLEANPEGVSVG